MQPVGRLSLIALLAVAVACGGAPTEEGAPAREEDGKTRSKPVFAPPDPAFFEAPQPSDEQRRKMEDLSGDLVAIAEGESGATEALTDDLGSLLGYPPALSVRRDVAASFDKALRGATLDEAHGLRLAEVLYAAMHLPYLPKQKRTAVRSAMVETLRSVGVAEADAAAVGRALERVRD